MKQFIVIATLLCTTAVNAASFTFSKNRLNRFYNVYLCEQRADDTNLSLTCSSSAPSNPSAPLPVEGYLPIAIVNDSTLPDNQVYVLITGKDEATLTQSFLSVNSDGIGSLTVANPGDNGSNYSYLLSSLPATEDGHVVYLPKIVGGAIWFSMQQKLDMPVNAPHNIVQPNFTNPNDANYTKNFDIFEVTYVSTGTNIAADATAVSFFSIPLYGYISTPDPGSASNTGLFQPRSTILSSAGSLFSTVPNVVEWEKLFLRNGSTILRLVSPGKAMADNIFDINYLDNGDTYGYSYISNIWASVSSFYRINSPIKITIPNGTLDTYHGVINLDNTITFTGQTFGYVIVLEAPTIISPTTTFDIFSGVFFIASDNSPGAADGVQLSKLFEEAIIAGLVPTANTLSNPYLSANQASFYTVNPNLSALGQSTGPWYDLYSRALHAQGFIYTYAFDEPLWPQVQITSQTLKTDTYIGITIGSIK